jgi:predicted dehydrogenase
MALGIGLIGPGSIGKVHLYCYHTLPFFYDPAPQYAVLGVAAHSRRSCLQAAALCPGISTTEDYRQLLARPEIELIDCCAPNYLHYPMISAALLAGKHVYAEKPLALNEEEAKQLHALALERHLKGQIAFQYRFVPAVLRAKELISQGALGSIIHFRAQYLHSGYLDPKRPLTWRLDKAQSGGGALFDLGSHLVDLLRFLVGEYKAVFASLPTFIPYRPLADGTMEKVELDDVALLMVKMASGAQGVIEASRLAAGSEDDLRFELHGSEGSLRFKLMEPNWLWFYEGKGSEEPLGGSQGFKKIPTVARYGRPAVFPSPKAPVGWLRFHLASQYDLLRSLQDDTYQSIGATFLDGLRVQEVLAAAAASQAAGRWIEIG